MRTLKILGIKITPAQPWELHAEISRLIENGGPGFILSGNIYSLNLARRCKWIAEFFERADAVRVDGAGVVLGARLLGHAIPKRLTWADWGWSLAEYLAEKGHSAYFLGGPRGVAMKAAEQLRTHAPGLCILGAHHGYFLKRGPENEAVINRINKAKPDILVVGMGMPLQEHWLVTNHARINAKVFITAGAAFEYLSGTLARCPKWMGEAGLEWLFRLMLEPKRMARRYIWGNTTFLASVLMERWGALRV